MAAGRSKEPQIHQRTSVISTTIIDESDVPKRQQHRQQSFLNKLHSIDVDISRKLSFCAAKDEGWRTMLIALEISGHGIPWIIGVVLAIYRLRNHQQQFVINVLFALLLDLVIVGLLKTAFRRSRPVYNEKDMFATVSVDNYSFPSGHSTRAAMVAGLFGLITSNPLYRLVFYIWAGCIATSRVVLGRHHVSDVVCGVLIGFLQYWVVVYLWLPLDTCHKILNMIPYLDIVH